MQLIYTTEVSTSTFHLRAANDTKSRVKTFLSNHYWKKYTIFSVSVWYIQKQLFTSVLVKAADIHQAARKISSQLLTIYTYVPIALSVSLSKLTKTMKTSWLDCLSYYKTFYKHCFKGCIWSNMQCTCKNIKRLQLFLCFVSFFSVTFAYT